MALGTKSCLKKFSTNGGRLVNYRHLKRLRERELFIGKQQALPVECSEVREENPRVMAINRALLMTKEGPKLSVADVKNLVMMNVSAAAQNHAIFVVYLGTWRRIAGRKMEKIKATVERGRRRGHLAILRVAGAREAGHHAGRQAGRRGAILAAGQHPQETAEVEARAEDVPRRNLADSRSFRKRPRLTCKDKCSYCSALLEICKMHRGADQISPIFRPTHRLFPGLNISARLFWLQVQLYRCQAPLLSIIWQGRRS